MSRKKHPYGDGTGSTCMHCWHPLPSQHTKKCPECHEPVDRLGLEGLGIMLKFFFVVAVLSGIAWVIGAVMGIVRNIILWVNVHIITPVASFIDWLTFWN